MSFGKKLSDFWNLKTTLYVVKNGMYYPVVGPNGQIDEGNKFPSLESLKEVYGENVEEY